MQILDGLVENPYILFALTALSIALTIAGLIPRGKKRTLSIVCATYPLVRSGKPEIPGVEVSYQGREVDDLSITRFSFWNSGKRAFMESDLAYGEVIRLYWDESIELFDAQLIKVTDESNKLRLAMQEGNGGSEGAGCGSQNSLSIKFDYMNSKDGAVLQVIHTGDAKNIKYMSKLKDGKVVLESEYFNESGHVHSPSRIESINLKTVLRAIACGFTIIGMDTIFIFTLSHVLMMREAGIAAEVPFVDTFGIGVIYALMGIMIIPFTKEVATIVGLVGKGSDAPYVPLELRSYFLFGDSYKPHVHYDEDE